MDRNFIIACAISLFLILIWGSYQEKKYPSSTPVPQQLETEGETTHTSTPTEAPAVPAPTPTPAGIESVTPAAAPAAAPDARSDEQIIEISNDLYRAEFSSYGGSLRYFELLQYENRTPEGAEPVVLTWFDSAMELALATPFQELGFGDLSRAEYRVTQPDFDVLIFERVQQGIMLRKTYRFTPDSYAFSLTLEVINNSDRSVVPKFEVRWPAHVESEKFVRNQQSLIVYQDGEFEDELLGGFGGAGFFSKMFGGGSDSVDPATQTEIFSGVVDWVGLSNRYFLSAMLPDEPAKVTAKFVPIEKQKHARTVLEYQPLEILPGKAKDREIKLYVGPKETARLDKMGRNLKRSGVMGYSWVSPLTTFFTWFLFQIHRVVPNYGWAIIVVTILVRGATYPIVAQQMKSMKKMAALQPKMKAIKEKHKDDRQAESQETMKLYKSEGVNPLGGCLPMFLQFPVFIGLFFALQSAIELRHAPFFGWINDLSAPETLFMLPGLDFPVRLLPFLMGGSMFLQQKITPMTISDPMQKKMMTTFMPLMLLVISYAFPSGLVVYWIPSNILGIAQQFVTNRAKSET